MHLMVHSRAFNNYYIAPWFFIAFLGILLGEEGKSINPNESNSSKRLAFEGISEFSPVQGEIRLKI